MTDGSNQPHSEIIRLAGEHWADCEAAASLLEDTKSAFLAQRVAMQGDIAVNRAENIVKASPEWVKYVKTSVEARKAANIAKVRYEYERARFTEWNSEQANHRAEMKAL